MLSPGDPAPWFTAKSSINPAYRFADAAAGRYLVLCFFGASAEPAARQILDEVERNQERFDVENACFFGVSTDPADENGRLQPRFPGVVFLWDTDLAVSRLFGAAGQPGSPYQQHSIVLDPSLRVMAALPFHPQPETHLRRLLRYLESLPPIRKLNLFAPVLVVPWVFEPYLCRTLIAHYEQHGGAESGFMRDVDGKTIRVVDSDLKRRKDYHFNDPALIDKVIDRLRRRLAPEIKKAFQFEVTRIERQVIVCYDSGSGGYFRQHRDDGTLATSHRRFAVTINLNTEEYEGGDLRFLEYGPRTYRAPTGGAIVFSCSLLHEALPVTRGKRYAYVPFLFDEPAALIQEQTLKFRQE
jgi:peroxiredoxin